MLAPHRAWVRLSGRPDYGAACSIVAMLQHEGPIHHCYSCLKRASLTVACMPELLT